MPYTAWFASSSVSSSALPSAAPANSPLFALARLGLGRAYVLQSDKAKAKATYQDFFAAWKDADPDVPVLEDAKAEYAKLQ